MFPPSTHNEGVLKEYSLSPVRTLECPSAVNAALNGNFDCEGYMTSVLIAPLAGSAQSEPSLASLTLWLGDFLSAAAAAREPAAEEKRSHLWAARWLSCSIVLLSSCNI